MPANSNMVLMAVLFLVLIVGIGWILFRPTYRFDLKTIDRFIRQTPIVISATTSPKRLKPCLENFSKMIQKGIVPSGVNIELNLPRLFGRTKEPYPENVISPSDRIKIFRIDDDEGPATKLLPTLDRYKDQDVLVITWDDDTTYERGMVELHGELQRQYRENNIDIVTCFSGLGHNRSLRNYPVLKNILAERAEPLSKIKSKIPHSQTYAIEGFGSVCYPTRVVRSDVIRKFVHAYKQCRNSDDLCISLALGDMKLPMVVLDSVYSESPVDQEEFGFQDDALHQQQNHFNTYEQCAILLTRHNIV
jgi:hypothetical protein